MNKVSVNESIIRKELLENKVGVRQVQFSMYWVTQKLTQIYTVNLRIRIGKVALFAIYICGNFWVTQYVLHGNLKRWLLETPCARKCWTCLNSYSNKLSNNLWSREGSLVVIIKYVQCISTLIDYNNF